MGSEISKALKQYKDLVNDGSSILIRLKASNKDVISPPSNQSKECEIDKNFVNFKSDLNGLKSRIETDIQVFNAFKRSILRLEEIFITLGKKKANMLDENAHINIKKIVHDHIIGQIENYEKILENRKNFSELQNKLDNSKNQSKKPKSFVAGLFGVLGVGAVFGYVGFSENFLGGNEVIELSKNLDFNGKNLLISGLCCVVVAGLLIRVSSQGAGEKIEKDCHDDEFISKLDYFSKLFENLSEICQKPPMNLIQVKKMCEKFGENSEDLIKLKENQEILSHLKDSIIDCINSQNKLKEAIDNTY